MVKQEMQAAIAPLRHAGSHHTWSGGAGALAQQRGHCSYTERETTNGVYDTWIPEQGRIDHGSSSEPPHRACACKLPIGWPGVDCLSADGHGPHRAGRRGVAALGARLGQGTPPGAAAGCPGDGDRAPRAPRPGRAARRGRARAHPVLGLLVTRTPLERDAHRYPRRPEPLRGRRDARLRHAERGASTMR